MHLEPLVVSCSGLGFTNLCKNRLYSHSVMCLATPAKEIQIMEINKTLGIEFVKVLLLLAAILGANICIFSSLRGGNLGSQHVRRS